MINIDYKNELDKAVLKRYKIDSLITSLKNDIEAISTRKISSLCRKIKLERDVFSYQFLFCNVTVHDDGGRVDIYFLMKPDNKKLSAYRKHRISDIIDDNCIISHSDLRGGRYPIVIKNSFYLSINKLLDDKTILEVK